MNTIFLIQYTASLLFLGLIIFILFKNPKALPNRSCALLLGCFFIWNFTTAFYTAAENGKAATLWLNISSAGWCCFPVFVILFALVFTRKEKFIRYLFPYILIVPAIFIYKQCTGFIFDKNQREIYGWISIWSNSIWSYIYYLYYISCILISYSMSIIFISKTKNSFEKRQVILFLTSGIIPIVLGSITDIILPDMNISSIPQLADVSTLIWAGGIVYAINKYSFLTLTPAYAASDILKTMSDSLVLIDPEGKIIEMNRTALKLLGYSSGEIMGSPAGRLFKNGIDPFAGKLNSFRNRQDFFKAKTGKIIPVSISSAIMHDKNNTLVGIVGIARDMRDVLKIQKKERVFAVEKARTQALQEKAFELQEAYDKLKKAQAMLFQSEKMAAVGQLAGGIAHEINNPMGVILGFSQSISARIKDGDPLYMPLKSIEREAIRCRKLIMDLLTFSRTGKTQAESIDLNQTIDETLSLIESQAKLLDIKIDKAYGSGLPSIKANKNQIQQVVVNICNNSIDAMPEGGKIVITTGYERQHIIMEISDTGKGMNEEVKKHIFEPFYTTKDVGKGTGLGLSLCFEIIRQHKGVIEVESEEGRGAAFRIKIPVN